ncbi:MAG: hypothetical protein AAGH89_18550 [Verrucomicrobiota bacterium]
MRNLGLITLLASLVVGASANAEEFPHDRLISEAKSRQEWKRANRHRKLELISEAALTKPSTSDPVSDRYTITFYGGPIDWVHFLNLAVFVYSGDQSYGEAQHHQWLKEGGLLFEAKKTRTNPTAATPDDLPSNALGALFGKELQASELEVEIALRKFIAPLLPVPDRLAKEFSHQAIVMGIPVKPTTRDLDLAYAWFSAMPLNLTKLINTKSHELIKRPFANPEPSGLAALRQAGFTVVNYRGRPVLIERMR